MVTTCEGIFCIHPLRNRRKLARKPQYMHGSGIWQTKVVEKKRKEKHRRGHESRPKCRRPAHARLLFLQLASEFCECECHARGVTGEHDLQCVRVVRDISMFFLYSCKRLNVHCFYAHMIVPQRK
eukprot:1879688-Pleurochrysis_carterae.AAC.1